MVHVEEVDDNMIANNLEPFYLTHPGEVIKDELEFRGISQRRLAAQIGVPASQFKAPHVVYWKTNSGVLLSMSVLLSI